ncbi:hypothetical protein KKC91_05065 [bacterium]|nr:hypothetical protein [bacterium]
MANDPICCYGWIPNLSGDIFLIKISELLNRVGYLSDSSGKYYKNKKISDIKEEECKIILSFPSQFENKNEQNELAFLIQELNMKAICQIKKNGLILIKTNFIEPVQISEDDILDAISTIYQEVKDIFHEHTHHHKEMDKLLTLVETDNENIAIKEIITQYQQKIFNYHHFLKDSLTESNLFRYTLQIVKGFFKKEKPLTPSAIEYVAQAEGEMIYALMFINLFLKGTDPNYEKYDFIFQNTYNSICGIRAKITHLLQHYSNKIMIYLTIILIILTLAIIFLD